MHPILSAIETEKKIIHVYVLALLLSIFANPQLERVKLLRLASLWSIFDL